MKYILFTDGALSARYDSAINSVIPDGALEVSDELFFQTINETDGVWVLVEGSVVKFPFAAPTLAELKKSQLTEINDEFKKAMQPIIDGIPDIELKSWQKQEDEARSYIADHLAHTPLIDSIASGRSVDKAELVTRIIAKADLFAGISGTLIGRRQALEDELNAFPESATPEDIAAITW